jgi:2-polyprenyl-3-methyl-5-hydroxy-6-metoxy-1,4-benzoquinol methylase
MRNYRSQCPGCKSNQVESVFSRNEWASFVKDKNDQRLLFLKAMDENASLAFDYMMRCSVCKTAFTDFVPPESALSGFYQHYYGNSGYLAKVNLKVSLNLRRIFALKLLTRDRRFVDVGCNVGCSVEAARRNGFAATGLELDATAIEHAKLLFPGNRFIAGSVEAAPAGEVFGLVYCTEVIEHVPDTESFVAALAKLVAPRGILSLTCPQAGPRNELIGMPELRPPEHLTLFSRRGIKAALAPWFKRVVVLPNLKRGNQVIAFKG